MWMVFLMGMLASGLGLHSWANPKVDRALSIFILAFGILWLAVFALLLWERSRRAALLDWLAANREVILKGGSHYCGRLITPQTQVTHFMIIVSAVFITTTSSSRLYFFDQDRPIIPALLYCLVCLVAGWWGFPHGIVYTPLGVWKNVTFAHTQTVADLLTAANQSPKRSPA